MYILYFNFSQKILLQEREKNSQIKVELEKERRTCEDLKEVLARERTALCYLQDDLSKKEKCRNQIEKEVKIIFLCTKKNIGFSLFQSIISFRK